jgi:DMSO/TMAO reductase YedYZ molybdopterin-dependent catalytic subunit
MLRSQERSLVAKAKPELSLFDTPEINAETPAHLLDDDITPLERLFVRNTGFLPEISAREMADWTLQIDGLVEAPSRFTLAQLAQDFPPATQIAVLECAGNGRAFFSESAGSPPWRHGGVGCAQWTGARLSDLLSICGVKREAVYTAHYAPDCGIDGRWPALSRGLPIGKALAPETLVAYALNGAPIPLLHGGPLRLVAPGYPGSAWHKWLTRITIRDREHDGERMTGLFYRLPRRPVSPGDRLDPAEFDVITDTPVKSVITFPREGFSMPAGGLLIVRGRAWSGHVALAAVEVSIDGGRSWHAAELGPLPDRFAWRRFEIGLGRLPAGEIEIVARAADAKGDRQPLDSAPWNPRGYCNTAAHRVRGRVG